MRFPLSRVLLGICVALILPTTSFAAGTTIRERAAQRAITRGIPVQPSQKRKSSSLVTQTVPRAVRYHRVTERPSRREIREDAIENSEKDNADLPRPSQTRESRQRDPEPEPIRERPSRPEQPAIARDIEATRAEILRLVNEERAKEGLAALTYNFKLEQAAQAHAQDMSDRDYFSHESPEGGTFDERISAAGYPGPCPYAGCRMRIAVGENLAKGFRTAESVVKGWMDSPGHKANILHPLFSELGVGIVGTYWAQEFGDVDYLE